MSENIDVRYIDDESVIDRLYSGPVKKEPMMYTGSNLNLVETAIAKHARATQ